MFCISFSTAANLDICVTVTKCISYIFLMSYFQKKHSPLKKKAPSSFTEEASF